MSQSLCILGRQPALGRAELESLYGSDGLRPVGDEALLIDKEPGVIAFERLGGTIKLCRVLTKIDTTNWRQIETYLAETIPRHLDTLPEGKLQLGLSVYGLPVAAKQLLASGLTLKKIIKNTGRSVRLIPNKEPALNSAQVLRNGLLGPLGWELVFVRDGNKTILAQTVAEQDIDAYAARDQARPKRDARVGMLPPKLAQIIINLAFDRNMGKDEENLSSVTILDPFCGTGVILQEAALMGYSAIGTDIEQRMVDYSTENLRWLSTQNNTSPASTSAIIKAADATTHHWPEEFDALAAETYLGRALSSLPSPGDLQKIIQDVNTIHKKFLRNLTLQTKPGFRLCLAVPAWLIRGDFSHLPLLDHLDELGYTRMSFVHARTGELIYHRPGQIVARELIVLIRK